MPAYIIQRVLQGALVLAIVGLIAFCMFRFIGDPFENILGQEATLEDRRELEQRLGLDKPIVVQYWRFITNSLKGEFGVSYRSGLPVAEMIAERLPATLELAIVSALMALGLGVLFGVITAIRRRGFWANVVMLGSLIGVSLPTFLIGVLLIWIFAVELGVLPSFGRGQTGTFLGWESGLVTWSGLKALILPAITLGLYQMTLVMRLVRAEMLEVLRSDYIRFARARGLSDRAVNFGHALKNTLLPVITIMGIQLGQIIAFAVVTETVFQWPGVGLMFINAVQFVDIPVMATYLLLVGVLFVFINLVVDVLYVFVDPRLKFDSARGH